jgi:hypothetical protein
VSGLGARGEGAAPISVGSTGRRMSARPWMGASFGYANVDSLDMSWLPLPRFESRAVGVAVCDLGARARVPHPISVDEIAVGRGRGWARVQSGHCSSSAEQVVRV